MKKKIILDILFYLGIPLLFWNTMRTQLGDYHTILIGMIPAVIYTVVTVFSDKQLNVTGIFFMSWIVLTWFMNLASHTAIQELWNNVIVNGITGTFYLLTIAIKRPMGMYFFIDYAFARGIPRERTRKLYRLPENFHYFNEFTLFLLSREIVEIAVLSFLIEEYGVGGYNTIQITSSVISYVFLGLTVLYVIYIAKKIKKSPKVEASTA